MKETRKAELRERAAQRAQGSGLHDEWGEKCPLEETGDEVFARWRGEVADEAYEGYSRRVFLLWGEDGQPLWVRGKWALCLEIDKWLQDGLDAGWEIVIVVGDRWEGQSGTSGFYYGVEAAPCDDPLPGSAPAGVGVGGDDLDIPFEPVL
jgi:hypothetical protein